jgi:uncharacterized damage-inducible protein DinB
MSETVDPHTALAPERQRVDPPLRAGEAESLLAYLDYHRATLRMKVSGLDREQLGRRLGSSTMTLGGLVKHLTLVEESWFSRLLAGNPLGEPWTSVDWEDDPDWEWRTGSTDGPEALMTAYEKTIEQVDAHIAAALERHGLDTLSVRESRREGEGHFSLRWILLHMIEEYARHNGHADLIRESIDGQVGE